MPIISTSIKPYVPESAAIRQGRIVYPVSVGRFVPDVWAEASYLRFSGYGGLYGEAGSWRGVDEAPPERTINESAGGGAIGVEELELGLGLSGAAEDFYRGNVGVWLPRVAASPGHRIDGDEITATGRAYILAALRGVGAGVCADAWTNRRTRRQLCQRLCIRQHRNLSR